MIETLTQPVLQSYALSRVEPERHVAGGQPCWLDRWCRERIFDRLEDMDGGQITVCDGNVPQTLGRTASAENARTSRSAIEPCHSPLHVRLSVHDPRFYRRVAASGTLGFAEAYFDRQWTTDDLTTLLRIFARNLDRLQAVDRGLARAGRTLAKLAHRLSRNTLRGSRRNIASHYDLSNDFFATFLDPTMMYSAAMFEEPQTTLEQASLAKLEAVCRKLDLQPDDHLLEIGTGWGGLAVYAARNFGCRVTTTTISREQHEYATRRVEEADLSDRVRVLRDDYRVLAGRYDKLVSIEMLEAVGHQYFDAYFAACDRLLKRGGRMLVQTITIPEQRYAAYLRSVDFIRRFIFAGGCLPSLAAIGQSVGRGTHLRLLSQHDFGHCYARTLREWRRRFLERLDDVRRLGFDDRFIRLWEYYLCYCEAAFLERAVGVSQLVWVKV